MSPVGHPEAPPVEERWQLDDLFEDLAAFERARQELRDEVLPTLDRHKGRLLGSAGELADALDGAYEARLKLTRLLCFASLKSDEDTRVGVDQARRQETQLLATETSRKLSFLRPEILDGDPKTIGRFLDSEPRLAVHRRFLTDLLRQRPYVLAPGEEQIMARTGLLRGQAGTLYGLFTDAELPRPEIELHDGRKVRLSATEFQNHRTTGHRADRQRIYPAYFSAYRKFRDTLGLNVYAGLKEHLFVSRTRGYASCLNAALDPDNVPESVYRNLITQVREALPLLHRYFKLRARFLGLERLDYTDMHCPLSSAPSLKYTTAQAADLVRRSMEPLGHAYGEPLASAFESRWIDWHPAEGKRSGAYATGWAFDVHPYVLLNYNGDYESVSTLTHEMGHAMHSYFSNKVQPFPTSSYPIFVAEVASTFNEGLLLQHVLGAATSPEAEMFFIGSYIDGIRGTLFRQTMFAEFELEIHERAERDEVLTGEKLDEIYLRLLREYHGHDQGIVNIADRYAIEWAAIPHLYYDFYVYQYATGIVAASALARSVLDGRPGARDRYIEFLSAGDSDYPLALLRRAGVDLEQATPYRETFATLDARLDRLEQLLPETTSGAG